MDDSALHFASTARKEAVLTSKNPRFLGPYSNTQDILVVGDGDPVVFSEFGHCSRWLSHGGDDV